SVSHESAPPIHAWHHQIGNDQRWVILTRQLQTLHPVPRRHRPIALILYNVTKRLCNWLLILNNQHKCRATTCNEPPWSVACHDVSLPFTPHHTLSAAQLFPVIHQASQACGPFCLFQTFLQAWV